MERKLLTLIVSLLCACAGDFSPTLVEDPTNNSSEDPGEDSSMVPDSDSSSTGADTGNSGSGSGSDSGDNSDDGSSSEGSGDSADPVHPGPGEPCDPFAAFDGTAPCDGDPETPSVVYTCVPAEVSPTPGDTAWEFRCVPSVDTQGDGEELGDPCSDAAGSFFAGCMNSYCLSNGLSSNPTQDVYQNHPPIPDDDACPFIWWSSDDPNHEGDGYYVKACCSDFCDANHPCDAGWTCATNQGLVPAALNGEVVGACVWQ